jgi:hypothetical protein
MASQFAFLGSVTAGSAGQAGPVTTGSADTSTADLFVAWVSSFGVVPSAVSDSKSNTWAAKTAYPAAPSGTCIRAFVCEQPGSVGTGHTFTGTALNGYPAITVFFFSGCAKSLAFDQESGANTASPGSVTPRAANSLVLSAISYYPGNTLTIDGTGWSTPVRTDYAAGAHMGIGAAYKIQGSATAENRTWTAGTGFTDRSTTVLTLFDADVVVMRPDGDSAVGSWTTDSGGTTNLYQKIDEGVIAATDTTDYVKANNDVNNSDYKVTLPNMPSNWSAMASVTINVRYALSGAPPGSSKDTYGISARVVNGATILAASDSGGTFQSLVSTTTMSTAFSNTGDVAFTYVNTSASSATWNGAVLEIRQTYTQSGSKDAHAVEVSVAELIGVYTVSVPPQTIDVTGTVCSSTSSATAPSQVITNSQVPAATSSQSSATAPSQTSGASSQAPATSSVAIEAPLRRVRS